MISSVCLCPQIQITIKGVVKRNMAIYVKQDYCASRHGRRLNIVWIGFACCVWDYVCVLGKVPGVQTGNLATSAIVLASSAIVLATANFAATCRKYSSLRNILKCELIEIFQITSCRARHTHSDCTSRPLVYVAMQDDYILLHVMKIQ